MATTASAGKEFGSCEFTSVQATGSTTPETEGTSSFYSAVAQSVLRQRTWKKPLDIGEITRGGKNEPEIKITSVA